MGVDIVPVRRAIVSVSNKARVAEFARVLADGGAEILSTGGTRAALTNAGVPAREISDYTGFPELMDGRVKTLHPRVHGGLLGRRDLPAHVEAMDRHGIPPIDMVIVNLYPFRETVARPGCELDEAVEQIDIGGPSMLRSAAKNHAAVAVVTDPAQYDEVADAVRAQGGTSLALRQRLALAAYRATASYDAAISQYLASQWEPSADARFPAELIGRARRVQHLRYGENPHQAGAWYAWDPPMSGTVAAARQLHGKELSYNNLLDLDSAVKLVSEFEGPAAVVVKHNNPCGAAIAETLGEAYAWAWATDPTSAFGGIVAFNRAVDRAAAEAIIDPRALSGSSDAGVLFLEAIAAPAFHPDALEILTTRPTWRQNVRLVELGACGDGRGAPALEWRTIRGGLLVQDADDQVDPDSEWSVVTRRAPTADEWRDLRFAWKVVKHVRSNAIVLARGGRVHGVGAGQMSRVEPVHIAGQKAGALARGCVMASEAFFPFRDGPDAAIALGVRAIIQPGGSKRDAESIAACDEAGLAMVFTGRRHFRH